MIKDKITPQLKKAFSESIDKTKNTHREHGFYMCADRLFPSEVKCEGSMCRIETVTKTGICPDKIQGFFHAHPHKPLLEMMIGRKISDIEIKEMRIKAKEFEKLGITIQSPSHRDVLTAFITRCEKRFAPMFGNWLDNIQNQDDIILYDKRQYDGFLIEEN